MRMKLAIAVLAFVLTGTSAAQTPGQPAARPDNYYDAGNRIDVTSPVAGDLIIAGRILNISEAIAGDILAAGWHVSLQKRAEDDVRIAGAHIAINAPVKGDLTIAGGEIRLGRETIVEGRAWVAGSDVRIDGTFDRELQIAGAHVAIGGELRGPVRIAADDLEILAGARVLGPITYESPKQARIATGATLAGPVTYRQIDPAAAKRGRWPSTFSTFLFIIHLSLAGVLLFLLFPRLASAGVETLRAQPVRSLAAGFLLLVMMPAAAIMLLMTVLGAPLGVMLGAVYVVMLLLGIITTAEYVGELEVKWLRAGPMPPRLQYFRALVLGVLTLALLRSVAGGWIVVPAIFFGMGAYGLWTYRHYTVKPLATGG